MKFGRQVVGGEASLAKSEAHAWRSALAWARRWFSRFILATGLCVWASLEPLSQTEPPLKGLARMRTLLSEAEALGAAGDFAKVIEIQPAQADARMQRALARFRQGRLAKSLEDFDRLVELAPKLAPQLWQRGVALSLAGRHEDARRQFEQHYRVNSNDVEVATWHFFSLAKAADAETARAKLLAVHGDSRVPMREILKLYSGAGSVEAVLTAADAAQPTEARQQAARFYARLYVAMYLDASGQTTDALPHAREAAAISAGYDFLGQAARLYAAQLHAKAANQPATPAAAPDGAPDETPQP